MGLLPFRCLFRELAPLERSRRQQGASSPCVREGGQSIALRRFAQAIFTGFHLRSSQPCCSTSSGRGAFHCQRDCLQLWAGSEHSLEAGQLAQRDWPPPRCLFHPRQRLLRRGTSSSISRHGRRPGWGRTNRFRCPACRGGVDWHIHGPAWRPTYSDGDAAIATAGGHPR